MLFLRGCNNNDASVRLCCSTQSRSVWDGWVCPGWPGMFLVGPVWFETIQDTIFLEKH